MAERSSEAVSWATVKPKSPSDAEAPAIDPLGSRLMLRNNSMDGCWANLAS